MELGKISILNRRPMQKAMKMQRQMANQVLALATTSIEICFVLSVSNNFAPQQKWIYCRRKTANIYTNTCIKTASFVALAHGPYTSQITAVQQTIRLGSLKASKGLTPCKFTQTSPCTLKKGPPPPPQRRHFYRSSSIQEIWIQPPSDISFGN